MGLSGSLVVVSLFLLGGMAAGVLAALAGSWSWGARTAAAALSVVVPLAGWVIFVRWLALHRRLRQADQRLINTLSDRL